ncbi:MAG TPA: helix-turn-helix domain-containing protein [Bryobacteraceae bacterium]|jgi:excisionase family DNA binding protein
MTPAEHSDKRLTIRSRGFARSTEAAAFLGITRQHLSMLVREGKIPAKKFGRALRIPWAWLIEQERCTPAA